MRHAEYGFGSEPAGICFGPPPHHREIGDGAMISSFTGANILVVEDDSDTALLLQLVLEDAGAAVTVAATVRDATRMLRATLPRARAEPTGDVFPFALLLLDLRLGDGDGADMLLALKSSGYRLPPVIVVSAVARETIDAAAGRIGAFGVLHKPFELQMLLDCVEQALRQRA